MGTFNQDLIKNQEEFFGPLYDYIIDDEITDVDWNGRELWLTYANNKREKVQKEGITPEFVESFSFRVANVVSENFNQTNVILEAETDKLRISFLHNSVTTTGTCFCIRKSLPSLRYTEADLVKSGYMSTQILHLLINAVKARMNIVICGETNTGKTELCKFLSQYIPDEQKVITIEDNPELHYAEINPSHDCISIKVGQYLTYSDAIKASLRQNPRWILLSEARSTEAIYLLQSLSTGENAITTIHCTDLYQMAKRFADMVEDNSGRTESKVYGYLDLGILIKKRVNADGKIYRYIDQLAFLYRDRETKKEKMFFVIEDGILQDTDLPKAIFNKYKEAEIQEPFASH